MADRNCMERCVIYCTFTYQLTREKYACSIKQTGSSRTLPSPVYFCFPCSSFRRHLRPGHNSPRPADSAAHHADSGSLAIAGTADTAIDFDFLNRSELSKAAMMNVEIDSYTKNPEKMVAMYSDLHRNIQDEFRRENVEIMSPHYRSVRNGNGSTIPVNTTDTAEANNQSNTVKQENIEKIVGLQGKPL
jgi:hypothetical protein